MFHGSVLIGWLSSRVFDIGSSSFALESGLSCTDASLNCIAPSLHDGARPGPNPALGRRIDCFETVSAPGQRGSL
ncbi:hypothetical protein BJX62DRAFT_206590 [Aspergillus germanicus]